MVYTTHKHGDDWGIFFMTVFITLLHKPDLNHFRFDIIPPTETFAI